MSAYNNRGAMYIDQGRLNHALDDLNRAIESDPSFARAYNNRGAIYLRQGKLEEAVNAFEQAIDLDYTLSIAHRNLGLVYRDTEDFPKGRRQAGYRC